MKKYEMTDETIMVDDHTLRRIVSLIDFAHVAAGTRGGYIESEHNLSQKGDAWVENDAKVYGLAVVEDAACVYGNAEVYGEARVSGYAIIGGNARVYDEARVSGVAYVCDEARVCECAELEGEAIIKGDAVVRRDIDYLLLRDPEKGKFVTWTRSNKAWTDSIKDKTTSALTPFRRAIQKVLDAIF